MDALLNRFEREQVQQTLDAEARQKEVERLAKDLLSTGRGTAEVLSESFDGDSRRRVLGDALSKLHRASQVAQRQIRRATVTDEDGDILAAAYELDALLTAGAQELADYTVAEVSDDD